MFRAILGIKRISSQGFTYLFAKGLDLMLSHWLEFNELFDLTIEY